MKANSQDPLDKSQKWMLTHRILWIIVSNWFLSTVCFDYGKNNDDSDCSDDMDYDDGEFDNEDSMGRTGEYGWTCNVCSGDESTGCLFYDKSECPRWS